MLARRSTVALATTLLVAGLAACAPNPASTPSPTPTGFASEEEAFAAAEATYRAYVDATNAYVESAAAEDPEQFLSGQALVDEQAAEMALTEADRKLAGALRIKSFESGSWTRNQVQIFVCLDLENVRVETADGEDVTPTDRSTTNLLEVRLTGGTDLRISSSVLRSEEC